MLRLAVFIPVLVLSLNVEARPAETIAQHQNPRPLTVADMIELQLPVLTPSGVSLQAIQMAPDGTHFLAVFYQGDVKRNGNWVVFAYGSSASLATAAQVNASFRLFTAANIQPYEWIKDLSWLDAHEQVAFIWDDGHKPAQVVTVNLRTHTVEPITQSPSAVMNFAVSQDGETLVYATRSESERDAEEAARRKDYQADGFAVTDQDLWSMLKGDFDGWKPGQYGRLFVKSRRDQAVREIPAPGRPWESAGPQNMRVSPDGKYCLFDLLIPELPQQWKRYTEPWLRQKLSAVEHDLKDNRFVYQPFLLEIATAKVRPLWNAPRNPRHVALWLDNHHVIIGPTFLPVEHSDADGLNGIALAEVDVDTGRFVSLPLSPRSRAARAANGDFGYAPHEVRAGGVVEVADAQDQMGKVAVRFKKNTATGVWSEITGGGVRASSSAAVSVQLREDSNTPPALFAVEGSSQQSVKIYDPDPALLEHFSFGRTELVHWREPNGTAWTGLLYYPVNFEQGKRYPLVIHTHGYSAEYFAWAVNGGHSTAYAAQALANRGIMVLALRFPDRFLESGLWAQSINTPREPQTVMAGTVAAIEHLKETGLIQPDKVGLVGFSRTGWYVEYILTHSDYPFGAAIAADNLQNSYGEYITAWDAFKGESESAIGAKPFGDGLAVWLREAPGFNADKIRTPLRMEQDSDYLGVLSEWELFSNLRHLGRPVEAFFVPDIEHGGAHPLVNPAQRLASQGGAVDWFDFWLNGHEDSDPTKTEQFRRWETLCDMQIEQNPNRPAFCVRSRAH